MAQFTVEYFFTIYNLITYFLKMTQSTVWSFLQFTIYIYTTKKWFSLPMNLFYNLKFKYILFRNDSVYRWIFLQCTIYLHIFEKWLSLPMNLFYNLQFNYILFRNDSVYRWIFFYNLQFTVLPYFFKKVKFIVGSFLHFTFYLHPFYVEMAQPIVRSSLQFKVSFKIKFCI